MLGSHLFMLSICPLTSHGDKWNILHLSSSLSKSNIKIQVVASDILTVPYVAHANSKYYGLCLAWYIFGRWFYSHTGHFSPDADWSLGTIHFSEPCFDHWNWIYEYSYWPWSSCPHCRRHLLHKPKKKEMILFSFFVQSTKNNRMVF